MVKPQKQRTRVAHTKIATEGDRPDHLAQPEPDRAPSTIDRRDGRDDCDPPIGDFFSEKKPQWPNEVENGRATITGSYICTARPFGN
jgi:hypothetical protein